MFSSRDVYIVAQVDCRVRSDRFFGEANLCVRYPTEYDTRPADLTINYDQDLNIRWYKIPDEQYREIGSDGISLSQEGNMRIVLLKGTYHRLWGYTGMKVVESKVVPIEGYVMP
jgi:hypothetical protein